EPGDAGSLRRAAAVAAERRRGLGPDPHVPEEGPVAVRVAGDALLLDAEREEVAELDDRDLVPEPALDLLPDRLAAGEVGLARHPGLEGVELRVARPARPVAGQHDHLGRVGVE